MALQSALDVGNTAARSIFTAIVMQRASWLHLSGFPKKVQATMEDLPFKGTKLFAEKTDTSLHTLKDSRATLRSLGIYTPHRRENRVLSPHINHAQHSIKLNAFMSHKGKRPDSQSTNHWAHSLPFPNHPLQNINFDRLVGALTDHSLQHHLMLNNSSHPFGCHLAVP